MRPSSQWLLYCPFLSLFLPGPLGETRVKAFKMYFRDKIPIKKTRRRRRFEDNTRRFAILWTFASLSNVQQIVNYIFFFFFSNNLYFKKRRRSRLSTKRCRLYRFQTRFFTHTKTRLKNAFPFFFFFTVSSVGKTANGHCFLTIVLSLGKSLLLLSFCFFFINACTKIHTVSITIRLLLWFTNDRKMTRCYVNVFVRRTIACPQLCTQYTHVSALVDK